MSTQPPRKPDVTVAPMPRKPSEWSQRSIPTPGPGRSTADPRTPKLAELARRFASEAASLVEAPPSAPARRPAAEGAQPSDPPFVDRTAGRMCGSTGLAAPEAARSFAGAMRRVQASWPGMTPAARRTAVSGLLNDTLGDAGVPPVRLVPETMPPGTAASFDKRRWSVQVGDDLFQESALPDKRAAEVADTLLHESRHAEQDFLVARRRAAAGASAASIQRALGVPDAVARAAAARPLPGGGRSTVGTPGLAECARVMDSSLYGAGGRNTVAVYTALRERHADLARAEAGVDRLTKQSGPAELNAAWNALYAAEDAMGRTQDAYLALPHEADAWAVGSKARKYWP